LGLHSEAARKRLNVCPGGHLYQYHTECAAIEDIKLVLKVVYQKKSDETAGVIS
jgi:hypothetical protein